MLEQTLTRGQHWPFVHLFKGACYACKLSELKLIKPLELTHVAIADKSNLKALLWLTRYYITGMD